MEHSMGRPMEHSMGRPMEHSMQRSMEHSMAHSMERYDHRAGIGIADTRAAGTRFHDADADLRAREGRLAEARRRKMGSMEPMERSMDRSRGPRAAPSSSRRTGLAAHYRLGLP